MRERQNLHRTFGRGMELARGYYETYGKAMIHEKFPEYEPRIAVGLVGEGSECYGFDDEYSTDHDFGPAFCMWLNGKDMQAIGRELQREYEKLPQEFGGIPVRKESALAGKRSGVWEIGEFYRRFLGVADAPDDWKRWLYLPSHYFAVAVNGQVFVDEAGEFSRVRERILKGYPEDVRIKKMVAHAAVMAQSGQYNYPRCLKRGEKVAAQLALAEFMKAGMSVIYLLNNAYAPFYKWMHRGMGRLEILSGTAELFTALADASVGDAEKPELVEEICGRIVEAWREQGLTDGNDFFLQSHLETLTNKIQNEEIRRLHWLEGQA